MDTDNSIQSSLAAPATHSPHGSIVEWKEFIELSQNMEWWNIPTVRIIGKEVRFHCSFLKSSLISRHAL